VNLILRRPVITALVCLAIAAAAYLTLRGVYGERPAYVHVRWAPSVDQARRAELERRYSLTTGEFREGTTWNYFLNDVSTSNIRALVEDPLVEDTHYLHRTKFRVWRTATRGAYLEGGWVPPGLEILAIASIGLGAIAAALAVLKAGRRKSAA
jgi:hypothetical protein